MKRLFGNVDAIGSRVGTLGGYVTFKYSAIFALAPPICRSWPCPGPWPARRSRGASTSWRRPVRQAAHRSREAGRPPDPPLAGDGGPRPHDHLQLERLRGRRPGGPDLAPVLGGLRPLGGLHRHVLRRSRVRARAAPRPRRIGRDRGTRDGRPVDHQRPERRRPIAHPEPVQLDVRPRPARRRLRLAVAGARGDPRHRPRGDRRRALRPPRPGRHGRPLRAPAAGGVLGSTGRPPGRSATSSPALSWGIGLGLVGCLRVARRVPGGPDLGSSGS